MQNLMAEQAQDKRCTIKQIIWRLLLGSAAALVLTLCVLLSLAAVLFFVDTDARWTAPVATVLVLLTLFYCAKFATAGIDGRRFTVGAAIGALYYILLYGIAFLLFAEFAFTVRTASFMLIGILSGGIGGAAAGQAAGTKKTRKRKKRRQSKA